MGPKSVLFNISRSNVWPTVKSLRHLNKDHGTMNYFIKVVAVRVLHSGLKPNWYPFKIEPVVCNSLSWGFIEDSSNLVKQDILELGL